MKLWHETHPRIAVEVMRSGIFFGGPIHDDNGVNLVLKGDDSGLHQARFKGAILEFDWNGPTPIKVPPWTYVKRMPDQIYEDVGHRHFVYHGSSKHLSLSKIILLDGFNWQNAIPEPVFPGIRLSSLMWMKYLCYHFKGCLARKVRGIEEEVRRLDQRPVLIQVQHGANNRYN